MMIPKLATEDGMTQGGIYMVTLGLANLLLIFTSSIVTIFFPVVAEMFGKEDKKGIVEVTSTSIRWIMLLSLPVLAMMIVYPGELLKMFYGTPYESGGIVLALFSIGLFVRSMSMPVGGVIIAVKRPGIELKVAIFAALVNVGLNFILIPMYGMNGSAIASMVALFVISGLLFHYGKEIFGFRLPPQTMKLVVTGIVAIVVMLLLKPFVAPLLTGAVEISVFDSETLQQDVVTKIVKLALMGILFALSTLIVYLLGVFVFKVIGEQEVQMMNGAMGKAGVPEKWRERITRVLLPYQR
jgi:O-antigen/teichoic acid export membrane protein